MIARPLIDRLLERVVCDVSTRCWLFSCVSGRGYGSIRPGGKAQPVAAHRVSYELFVGPIPDGMELHHTCDNRRCVSPSHLQPVDRRTHLTKLSPTNIAFIHAHRTHCPKGHPLTEDNLVPSVRKRGARNCLRCKRDLCRDYSQRRRANDPEYVERGRDYARDYQRRKREAR